MRNDNNTTTNKNDNKKNNWNYLNAKTRYDRLHLPDIFGSEQLSAILGPFSVLHLYYRTCCVSKLREAAETWLRRSENWRQSLYDNNNSNT